MPANSFGTQAFNRLISLWMWVYVFNQVRLSKRPSYLLFQSITLLNSLNLKVMVHPYELLICKLGF